MEEVLIPIALFAIAPLIVWAVCAYRFKTKKAVMKLLEVMTNKGEAISPEIIRSLGIQPRSPDADLRTGSILIALAIALFALGFIIGEIDAVRGLSGVAMFPFLIGATYLGLWKFVGRKETLTI